MIVRTIRPCPFQSRSCGVRTRPMGLGSLQRLANHIGLAVDAGCRAFSIKNADGSPVPGLTMLSRGDVEREIRKRYIDFCASSKIKPHFEQFE
jgi:hypothetical protein